MKCTLNIAKCLRLSYRYKYVELLLLFHNIHSFNIIVAPDQQQPTETCSFIDASKYWMAPQSFMADICTDIKLLTL